MLKSIRAFKEYLDALFVHADHKPRVVEERDGWSGMFSAVSAGTGVALTRTCSITHSTIASNSCA